MDLPNVPSPGPPPPRDPVAFLFLVVVAAVAVLALFRVSQPAPPAPAVPVQPAPAPEPRPAPSPCGPNNRCPYRQAVPFEATCPYCRNRLVAVPPSETGRAGVAVPALKDVQARPGTGSATNAVPQAQSK